MARRFALRTAMTTPLSGAVDPSDGLRPPRPPPRSDAQRHRPRSAATAESGAELCIHVRFTAVALEVLPSAALKGIMPKRLLRLLIIAASACVAHAQQITVYSGGNVTASGSRQLTAYVPLSPNTVTWSVNGVAGGDATHGTVSASGLFKAPATIPTANAVSVRATSTAYPVKSHAVTLTITQPAVQLWGVSPKSVPVGDFTLSLNGANFHSGSVVKVAGVALATTLVSSTSLRASGTALAAQAGSNVSVIVVNGGLGGTTSSKVTLGITAAPAVAVSVSPATANVTAGASLVFTAAVSGTSNTAVAWSVNNAAGGSASFGTISGTGLYIAPATAPNPATVIIRATSVADVTASASATAVITTLPGPGPGQGTENLAAARILEQAAFGPTPAELARVKSLGVTAWLDEQFGLPETPIANPGAMSMGAVQSQYLNRLSAAPDQLRQRVAGALSQIIVISANKNIYPDEIVPYLQILSRNAFGNYRTLLGDISQSSQMGKYLDLANSNKPTPGSAANENFARELMQLFTIGLYALNPDGTRQLDDQSNPIRAYDQSTVQRVALALTGWTFPGAGNNNWENFSGPLQPREINHDTSAKTLVGVTLPAGQSAVADMAGVLDWLFNHQNTGPFVATRLVRALVKSNPTPAYIARISAVFADNGTGVRGDLRAIVRAILTDAEARDDAIIANSGRLKDPIYNVVAFARALGGSISATNVQAWTFSRMSQTPLAPASVFGFYSPLFRIPRSTLIGSEFQIYGPTEAVLRGNFFWQIISNPGSDFPVNLAPFDVVAGDTVALIDAVDQTLLYGRMPVPMRQSLANAINAQGDATGRVRTALYLTALSGFYAVQY